MRNMHEQFTQRSGLIYQDIPSGGVLSLTSGGRLRFSLRKNEPRSPGRKQSPRFLRRTSERKLMKLRDNGLIKTELDDLTMAIVAINGWNSERSVSALFSTLMGAQTTTRPLGRRRRRTMNNHKHVAVFFVSTKKQLLCGSKTKEI